MFTHYGSAHWNKFILQFSCIFTFIFYIRKEPQDFFPVVIKAYYQVRTRVSKRVIHMITYSILSYIYDTHTHTHISVSSVAQSCLTLCDTMDCSKPGFPIHHQLQHIYIYIYKTSYYITSCIYVIHTYSTQYHLVFIFSEY